MTRNVILLRLIGVRTGVRNTVTLFAVNAPPVDASFKTFVWPRSGNSHAPLPAEENGLGRSDWAIVPQTGAADADPFPVCVKKFLVAEVFPASRAAAGVEFS